MLLLFALIEVNNMGSSGRWRLTPSRWIPKIFSIYSTRRPRIELTWSLWIHTRNPIVRLGAKTRVENGWKNSHKSHDDLLYSENVLLHENFLFSNHSSTFSVYISWHFWLTRVLKEFGKFGKFGKFNQNHLNKIKTSQKWNFNTIFT